MGKNSKLILFGSKNEIYFQKRYIQFGKWLDNYSYYNRKFAGFDTNKEYIELSNIKTFQQNITLGKKTEPAYSTIPMECEDCWIASDKVLANTLGGFFFY